MNFPFKDLTNQYISRSYQDILQQYPSSSNYYVLDGLGNVVFIIPSASLGQTVITSDITSSMTVLSASYSQVIQIHQQSSSFASSSVSSSYSLTASYVSGSSASSTSSSYALTSSVSILSNIATTSIFSDTASYVLYTEYSGTSSISAESISSSYSNTSSYSVSSSNAITASYSLNGGSGGTSLSTGSMYPITASWSNNALTASYIGIIPSGSTESSSYSLTSSYSLNAGSSGLSIASYDYSLVEYNGPLSQWSKVYYRLGGISGSIVNVVTAIYSGSIFIGVSKSLS